MTLPDYPKDTLEWAPRLPDEWLRELGRIAIYAGAVEENLHLIFWKYAGIHSDRGSIITGDQRPNRLADDIIKLMSLKATKRRMADMRLLLTEYKGLAKHRNECVHWTWGSVQPGKDTVTVMRPAYKGAGDNPEYSLDDLRSLANDFAWLWMRLGMHLATDKNLRAIRAQDAMLSRIIAPAPWLDKLPPPNPKSSAARSTRKERTRGHRSSSA